MTTHSSTARPELRTSESVANYLSAGFLKVPGMSSRFSAEVCAELLAWQNEQGVIGSILEIGVYEGRFFIAMALSLGIGETGIAVDPFNWPDEQVLSRFLDNCSTYGVSRAQISPIKSWSKEITPQQIHAHSGGLGCRFIHIDGNHTKEAILLDLQMSSASLTDAGLLCLDDMLNPIYPDLIVAVHDFLKDRRDLVLLAIIDRSDLIQSSKFLICRRQNRDLYRGVIASRFAANIFRMPATFLDDEVMIIAPPSA